MKYLNFTLISLLIYFNFLHLCCSDDFVQVAPNYETILQDQMKKFKLDDYYPKLPESLKNKIEQTIPKIINLQKAKSFGIGCIESYPNETNHINSNKKEAYFFLVYWENEKNTISLLNCATENLSEIKTPEFFDGDYNPETTADKKRKEYCEAIISSVNELLKNEKAILLFNNIKNFTTK